MESNSVSKLTEEQYLAIERAAGYKSEFVDGVMCAMSGASLRHSDLASNIIAELRAVLHAGDCKAFNSNLRVRVAGPMYTYPDVTVVCGKPLLADEHQDVLLNPIVIFEVLSPTTEKYDRGAKFQHYRTIPSLREYILVDQDKVRIEQYTRQDSNTWTLRDYQGRAEELKMDSIGISVPLERILSSRRVPARGYFQSRTSIGSTLHLKPQKIKEKDFVVDLMCRIAAARPMFR